MAAEYVPYEGPVVTRADARAAGKTRFFTNRPCKRGHISERSLASQMCLTCMSVMHNKARRRVWYLANRDKILADQVAWVQANPGYRKNYYAENCEREKLNSKKWRDENPDKVEAASRAHYARSAEQRAKRYNENKAAILARGAAWKALNKEARKAQKASRRARKLGSGGSHTVADQKELMALQKGKCAHSWCRAPLKAGHHVDHIMPLKRGGSNDRRNLQLLCPPCNLKKHAKHPIDFAQENGLLL